MGDVPTLVDHLFRHAAGRMVAALARRLGPRHLQLAEEAVQDALVSALQTWPFRGAPDRPEAWLFQVARRSAIDRLRHGRMADGHTRTLAAAAAGADTPPTARLTTELTPLADDELALMFLTCHPALPPESRVALTLKLVGGFGVPEIARALLAEPAGVAQRLVRAKRQLRDTGAPFGLPDADALTARLASVQQTLYLLFTEGVAPTSGDALVRADIAAEALRLATALAEDGRTATPATHALRALMLLHAARLPARESADGAAVVLRDQDRARWDRQLIAEGVRSLDRAARGPDETRYHLEAAIAACHAVAPSFEATDWPAILALYDALAERWPSPMVALNRAVALGEVHGPGAALEALLPLDAVAAVTRLPVYHAVLGDAWARRGDAARARAAFREALARGPGSHDRRLLEARLHGL